MKSLFFICFIVVGIHALEKYYDSRYDYYDIDHFVQNPRLLKKYLDCFLEKGPCTPIGRVFKLVLPEIVVTACKKCSPSQKRFAHRTFGAFKKIFPENYTELRKKLDSQNKYFDTFLKAIARNSKCGKGGGLMFVNIKALSLSAAASSLSRIDSKRINMKTFVVLACLVLTVLAADKYNPKYDNFDVETLVSNERLLKSYINCFLDKGRCTAEGTDFKKALPEAVETICGKCSEKQKVNIKRVIKAIQQKHPGQWEELVKKNDPSGKHRANFEKFIQES